MPEAPDTASCVIPSELISDQSTGKGQGQEQTGQNQQDITSSMSTDQLRQFFAHISRDPSLRVQVLQAVSADAAALIAQELGYEVSGDELLRFSGKSSSGVSVTKIQHPGEYH